MNEQMELTPYRKPLETEFEKSGFRFHQIERHGNVAIFEKTRIGGTAKSIELIRVQSHNGGTRTFDGKEHRFEPAEYYPGSESWGSQGWTPSSLEAARTRMAEMISVDGRG